MLDLRTADFFSSFQPLYVKTRKWLLEISQPKRLHGNSVTGNAALINSVIAVQHARDTTGLPLAKLLILTQPNKHNTSGLRSQYGTKDNLLACIQTVYHYLLLLFIHHILFMVV